MSATELPAGPLRGITVLDFTKVLAGPICAQFLADMGADVIKVESTGHGDDTRRWPPFCHGEGGAGAHEDGTVFVSANRGKRSIAMDLKSEGSREILARMAAKADVAIESFGPGVAGRLGVDAKTLREINPRLVHCSISGFGSQGPMSTGKGYDVILQAFSGMLSVTGNPGDPPIRVPFSPIDQATGYHAAIGILGALFERSTTGLGSAIEASLFDSSVAFMGYLLQSFWERGTEPQRHGSGHESLCPYEAFQTADAPILLGVANDSLWRAFCNICGEPELARNPKFATNADRVSNRKETIALVQEILARRPREEWIPMFNQAGIPCSPINTLGDLSHHPHLDESGMRFAYRHPAYGALFGIAQPLKFNGRRSVAKRPPPLFGEHTGEILREFQFKESEIDALLHAGDVCGTS